MNSANSSENDFLIKLTELIEINLTNPQFGVSMLARELGMSRSNLHRKVNEITKITVSQFINQVRLKKAKEILSHTTNTVSEVAYEVGFSNVSYFIKCFHKYYGYSPGEVGNRNEAMDNLDYSKHRKKQVRNILLAVVSLLVLAVVLYILSGPFQTNHGKYEKSIAVLPFSDNSPEEGNEYIINGLRREIINNLEKVKELRVMPGSATEKYKEADFDINKIAKELKVNYILSGSGQKIGRNIKITLELIDINTGFNIWTQPFKREVNEENIFDLQEEVALVVSKKLEATITPEEEERIKKIPTQSKEAWDLYSKGLEIRKSSLVESVPYFENAIQYDSKFALAYAQLAITSYLIYNESKDDRLLKEIMVNSDYALSIDNQIALCQISKAYYYFCAGELNLARPLLEQALELNPNSAESFRLLSRIYDYGGFANNEKYLKYSLKTIKYHLAEQDSIEKAYDYNRAARALRINGFYNLANEYIKTAIQLNPENTAFLLEKGEILIEQSGEYLQAREILTKALLKDSTHLGLLRTLFSNYYFSNDFKNAYNCYKKMLAINSSPPIVEHKDYSRLAIICDRLGMHQESEIYLKNHKEICRQRLNPYSKNLAMLRLYCLEKNREEALLQLNLFIQHEYHFKFDIRLFHDDSVFEFIRNLPEFDEALQKIETKFSEKKEQIRKSMEAEGLM